MSRPLRVGITCHPATGGSGIIATEIGVALRQRGHEVHFIAHEVPVRLRPVEDDVRFHRVDLREYPPLQLGAYPLALAARMAQVCAAHALDILHVHYAVPHALSADLARQLLLDQGLAAPRVITTLHGTDITQVGSDPCFQPTTRLALLRSDALTVPSAYLRQAALDGLRLPASTAIEVIPNFVDTARFCPAAGRSRQGPAVLLHSSNFRPLKRVDDVVRIFAAVQQSCPARLLLVGDGPERPRVEALVRELGLGAAVRFLGLRQDFLALLQASDVFLLPSATEGFGLAALEALACGVPVVASRVGGLPEVVAEGETGLLCEAGDVAGMAAAVLRLLEDPALHQRMSEAARRRVEQRWQRGPLLSRYEDCYHRALGA